MNAKSTCAAVVALFCFHFAAVSQCTFTVTATPVHVTCFNGTNGAISVNVTGGTAPYQYQLAEAGAGAWQSGNSFAALAAATYPVSVRDALGCIQTVYVSVNQPPALSVSYTAADPTCSGSSNGNISVSVSGGTSPYTYSWMKDESAFSTSQDISGLTAGNYTLTITDNSGCTAFPIVSQQIKTISFASGFNQDVVANGTNVAANAASNTPVDQSTGYIFYASGYSNSNGAGSYGLPSTGSFASAQTALRNYQLGPYNSNNALVLHSASDPSASSGGATSGTFSFNTQYQSPYEKLYVVGTTGSGTGVVDYTVHFTDGSNQTGSLNFPDWFLASSSSSTIRAIGALGRVSRANPGSYDGADNFNLWETPVNISGANQSKVVQSIDFSWSSLSSSNTARISLLAITGYSSTTSGIRINDGPPSSVTPAVAVVSNASGNQFCSGQSVTFTATPENGGSSPSYQWKRNGFNVGSNSPAYTNSSLSNNDQVRVVMTAGGGVSCLTTTTANSNTITMTSATKTASVSVSATASSICSGQPVTFTATPANGGTSPSYQWKLNGSNTGTNSPVYSNSSLNDNDQVRVVMTSNIGCATNNPATSTNVTMNVEPSLDPTVSISKVNPVATFNSSVTNAGSTPGYQWYKNGAQISGANSSTYFSGSVSLGEAYSLKLTSSYTCKISPSVMSNYITINSLFALPVTMEYFTATAGETKKVNLQWKTSFEENNDVFIIQRKQSSQSDFESIATVPATNNSSGSLYHHTDIVPQYGVYQYRLLQRDKDGQSSFSKIVSVNLRGTNGFTLHSNPVSNGLLTITVTEASGLRLYNSTGQLVLQRQLSAGQTALDVSRLAKGIYHTVVNDETKTVVIE